MLAVLAAAVLPVGGALSQGALSGTPCAPAPAKAVSVQGTVESKRPADAQWQPVRLNDTFCPGDLIRVQAKSRADIVLLDQSVMRLSANSTIMVETPKEQTTGVVSLLRGATNIFSRGRRSLEVNTPFTVAGVRGTEFFLSVETDKTLLTVFEGTVLAENSMGSLLLDSGQSAVAESGKPPVLRTVVRPRDAVQWTLYYPPVVYFRPDEFPSQSGWQGMVTRSVELYAKGDLAGALQSIENAPADVRDPRVFVYRAQLSLAVGRVDDARADIDRALQFAANDASALSLLVIIAIVQNDKDRALAIAEKNVAANPTSATARLALSFAQQARFDLSGARASVEKAVELDPRNALAFSRLAEINSSFGDLDATFAAARKAVALDPNVARTQTVLGFAYLTEVKTAEARAAFDRAILLDQGDPLPRLGLGLAKIRDGRLDEGGRDIEIAASLDPANSIVRAYLGKLYYEEKRFPLDEREFKMAEELDPKDPTAFFYDAILKQTTNRPVEALQAMEQAIALNDNRAVYRSELLLDSDNASRSASLARIYTDLGFQQLGLVEGYKSVNADPTNFSAHRFLSDTYSVLPRHEIARVSELLQSQLLQPVNLTPLQPRLAVSNLALISSGGPGTASFSEFNPLFTGDGYTAQFTGMGGEHGTYAADAVVAGLVGKGAFSLGYSGFQTDGFRVNNDQKDQLFDAFGQYDFTPQTSVQAEYRYRNTKQGDLALRFFESDFLSGQRNNTESDTFRAGFRHAFSPGSIVLASVIYQNRRDTVIDDQTGEPITFSEPQKALSGELAYLFRSPRFNLTAGAGYSRIDAHTDITGDFGTAPSIPAGVRHTNAYAYAYFRPLDSLTLTGAVSADFLSGDSLEIEGTTEVNPKFGVEWNPAPGTTLRAAAFKVLKRTLVTDQTLEPTQVAGFNQFFDDLDGATSWRYGAGIDQKLGRDVFAGAEFSRRDVKSPFIFTDPEGVLDTELRHEKTTEYLGRAYAFWTPHPWWAFSAQYLYEKNQSEGLSGVPLSVKTQRAPLAAKFFHPSGFSAGVTTTRVNQDVQFVGGTTGSSTFWILDAALSYRLPNRYGFIAVGGSNLTDKHFNYYDTDLRNGTLQPSRMLFARITLALP